MAERISVCNEIKPSASRLVNGKSFVKVRKIRKQTLLDQSFDTSELKAANSTKFFKSLHQIEKAQLSERNSVKSAITQNTDSDAYKSIVIIDSSGEFHFWEQNNIVKDIKDENMIETSGHNSAALNAGNIIQMRMDNSSAVNNEGTMNKNITETRGHNSAAVNAENITATKRATVNTEDTTNEIKTEMSEVNSTAVNTGDTMNENKTEMSEVNDTAVNTGDAMNENKTEMSEVNDTAVNTGDTMNENKTEMSEVNDTAVNTGDTMNESGNQEERQEIVNSSESLIRKPSTLLQHESARMGRRNSIVPMSSRKQSLSPSTSKNKIRKTSFVAPPTIRRKNSSINVTVKNHVADRPTNRKELQDKVYTEIKNVQLAVSIKQFNQNSTIAVSIDSVVNSLQTLFPTSVIEINDMSGQCLCSSTIQDRNKDTIITAMPPRNASPMTVLTEKSNITEAISEIKQKPNNLTSLIDFCRKMATFANDDSLHVLLAKQEGISHIIKAMVNFKENHQLIRSACQTLAQMTIHSDANCIHIYKVNGISLLLDLLQLYIDEAEILLMVLNIVGHLSMTENAEIVDSLLEKSCHTIVLTTMSRHGDSTDIVKQCCFILSHLVNSVEIARSLMFIGGVHVIIGAMRKYKDNNEVLENGCRALGSFAIHDEVCMDVANAGAVKIVLHALERSANDEYLLECSIWALACLTKYDEACRDVGKSCSIQHLLKSMKTHPEKETIQEYGCWIICNLVAHNTVLDLHISYEIITVLLDATGMFIENVDLQEQILFTVSEIITTEESILDKFINSSGVAFTIKTMSQYPDHCAIQEHGCRIIGNAAVKDGHRSHVETEGGSKAVISAMLTLDNCPGLQEVGCLALTNITANVHKNKMTAVKNGCIAAVFKAIRICDDCEHILLSGLKTICNVIEIDEACYNFLEEDGLDIMSSILFTNKTATELDELHLFAGNALSMMSSILGIDTNYLDKAEKLLWKIINSTSEDPEAILCLIRFYEHMLQTENGYRIFKQKDALSSVYRWMDVHDSDIHMQTSCCKILAAVSLYDKDTGTEIYNVIEKRIINFPEDCDIQLICCGAIVYIADKNEVCKSCLVERGAVSLVMDALKRNATVEKLVDVGLMALDTLLENKVTESKITEDTFHFVLQSIRQYPDNSGIQIHGCHILSKLQYHYKDGRFEAETRDTCNHLVNVLKRRRSDGELQTAATAALDSLLIGKHVSVAEDTKDQLMF